MRFLRGCEDPTVAEALPDGATPPQPEREEAKLRDPGLRDLSWADWKAILVRAAKEAKDDYVTDVAAALAYYAFLAVPAALLVAVGVFSIVAGPDTVESMMERLEGVVPSEVIELLRDSLTRATENQRGGLALIVVGGLLALWTTTSALNALMRGLNRVYDREETRGFVRQRLTALVMLGFLLFAFALSFGLLVLGPALTDWIGGALDLESVFGWIWWTAEWPILLLGLLLAFAGILYLGPNVDHPRWRFLTPGSLVAVLVWLAASGLFAFYVSRFGSYNKAWGSLAAVIIMLTWLWLSALALLFGAEVNAEAERSRELRQGKPAERDLQAPPKA
jgi:membrane protein